MARLSSASKKAAASVASKIGGNGSTSTTASNPAKSASTIASSKNDVTVPGLINFTPDNIQGMLPKHEDSSYSVSNPLSPPESLPQVSQQQFDKSQAIYQGATRAVKLTGMAFDLVKERFTTSGKQVDAIDSGVKLATKVERTKGSFLDYLAQVESTSQKDIALGVSRHKTATDGQKAVYDIQTMDEKLEQSRIAANLARLQTEEKMSGLSEFQRQLSGQK
jgi:hypothetical protein